MTMGLFDIFNIFRKDKRKTVYTPLNEDLIRRDEIVKAQQKKIMAQEAQLSQIYAHEKIKRDKEKDKEKEQKINKKLVEQSEDLRANRMGKMTNLDKFYYHIFFNRIPEGKISRYYSNFAKNLEFRDRDNKTVLGKWGGMYIASGGKLVLKDINGDIVSFGKTLSHILYKPDAFENMARDSKLLLPVDENGIHIEDLEDKEIPEPIDFVFDDETGKVKRIVFSKVKFTEVRKYIERMAEDKNNLASELERAESVTIKIRRELDDLKRSLRMMEGQYYSAQSELSKNLNVFIETEKRTGDMHTQLVKLIELKSMYELLIEKKDQVIDTVMEKLKLTGERKLDLIKAELKDDLEYYKKILPNRIEIKESIESPSAIPVQPGEIIRR